MTSAKTSIHNEETPIDEIIEALQEKRPLPLGMKEFEDFFARIWSGALLTFEPGKEEIIKLSAKNVLANEMIHLPSSQTHESDIYFINRIRKVACNQICLDVVNKTKAELKKILEEDSNKECT